MLLKGSAEGPLSITMHGFALLSIASSFPPQMHALSNFAHSKNLTKHDRNRFQMAFSLFVNDSPLPTHLHARCHVRGKHPGAPLAACSAHWQPPFTFSHYFQYISSMKLGSGEKRDACAMPPPHPSLCMLVLAMAMAGEIRGGEQGKEMKGEG